MPKFSAKKNTTRGLKAKEAACDLLDVLIIREQKGLNGLKSDEIAALQALLVGRVERRLGNGWCDVFCQDNKTRRCHIRGVLRSKKNRVRIDMNDVVVVALENPMTELGDSDEEGTIGISRGGGDKGYIVGLFGESDIGKLKKTRINPRVFTFVGMDGEKFTDDFFCNETEQNEYVPRLGRNILQDVEASGDVSNNYDEDDELIDLTDL